MIRAKGWSERGLTRYKFQKHSAEVAIYIYINCDVSRLEAKSHVRIKYSLLGYLRY